MLRERKQKCRIETNHKLNALKMYDKLNNGKRCGKEFTKSRKLHRQEVHNQTYRQPINQDGTLITFRSKPKAENYFLP